MTCLIAGAGAMGLLYGGYLSKAGHPVILKGRDGILPSQEFKLEQVNGKTFSWHNHEVKEDSTTELILILTKAYQAKEAVKQLLQSNLIATNSVLVLMHNGMGTANGINEMLPKGCHLYLASSRHGALKLNVNHVRHTGVGLTDLGLFEPHSGQGIKYHPVLNTLELAIGNVKWHQDIRPPLWQKLIINSVINPLTARDHVPNGAITSSDYRLEVTQLCEEACQVAQACGINLDATKMSTLVLVAAEATQKNRSSMLQDFLHKRPLEIDYINGYLLQQAQLHQISIPIHEKLVHQLKQTSRFTR